jgi:hypothetical protein
MPVLDHNLPGSFDFLPKPVAMVVLTIAAFQSLAGVSFFAAAALAVLLA